MNRFVGQFLSTPINLLPADWITIAYLAITGVLIVIFRKNLARWYIYLLARTALTLAILLLSFTPESWPPLFQILHDWYPLATIPTFYREVEPLTQMIFQGYLDDKVLKWEDRLFKGQPSIYLSERFPSTGLSGFLHLGYFSYYPIVYSLAGRLYFQGRHEAFYETVFAEILVFNVCLIWYLFTPVAGPRYMFEKIKGNLAEGFFHRLTHAIVSRGSSKGTAFPSSHCAVAVIVLLCAARYDLLVFIIVCPFCFGLVIGTIYGRFHYAVDAIIGTVLACVTFGIAPIVYRLLL